MPASHLPLRRARPASAPPGRGPLRPRRVPQAVLALLAGALLTAAPGGGGSALRAAEVRVATAANFTHALQRLAPTFERGSGHRVVAGYASTGTLYAQIRNGAPYDVLLAADAERPRRLEAEGLAVPGTRFTYAVGRLALWSATPGLVGGDSAAPPAVLRSGAFATLAIANPRTAPYGAAARAVLERMGLWEGLQGRLVQGENVAQVWQFVASGTATLGFVALAQVRAQHPQAVPWLPPPDWYPPIAQQAVLLRRGEGNPAARALLAYLRTPAARAELEALGYAAP